MGTFVAQTGHTKIVEKLTVKNNKLYWDHKLIKTGTLSGWPKFFVGLSTVTAILVGIVQINQEICFIDSRSCINSKQPIGVDAASPSTQKGASPIIVPDRSEAAEDIPKK